MQWVRLVTGLVILGVLLITITNKSQWSGENLIVRFLAAAAGISLVRTPIRNAPTTEASTLPRLQLVIRGVGAILLSAGGVFTVAMVALMSGDDDFVQGVSVCVAISLFGLLLLLGGVRGGETMHSALVTASAVFAVVAATSNSESTGLVVSVVAATTLSVCVWLRRRIEPASLISLTVGVVGALVIIGLPILGREPQPTFFDPFVQGFDVSFAEAGLPPVDRDNEAFNIVGRGSWTEVRTLVLVDVSAPCPPGDTSCVSQLLDQVDWIVLTGETTRFREGALDIEVRTDLGRCSGYVHPVAVEADDASSAEFEVEASGSPRWLFTLYCSPTRT